jgi:Domain of unknown function (DUF1998)
MAARPDFRKSQGVVPFGVGAVIDFKEEALMSAGLDVWPTERAMGEVRVALLDACRVVDGRLAARLTAEAGRRISFFLTPAEAPERAAHGVQAKPDRAFMPFVRFPNWYFCPRCRVLKRIPWNSPSRGEALKCSHLGRRVEGKGEPCGALSRLRRPSLSPVRFVVACESGHIMDFPWNAWAHKDVGHTCDAASGELYLYSTPAAGLAGIRVGCTKCNASNSMAGAFREDALADIYSRSCPGERPWLGPESAETGCNNIPQTIQRGASNAYFAKVVSSILIPPYSARIQQILDRPDVWDEIQVSPVIDGKLHEPWLRTKAKNLGVDADAFVAAVYERLGAAQGSAFKIEEVSEDRYRHDEYQAFVGPRPPRSERDDFDTELLPASTYNAEFADLFERIVLVRKLRETRVLTGFSRLVPVEALKGSPAALSLEPKNWLPGFSVRGEGIFLELNGSAVRRWSSFEEIKKRAAILQARSDQVARQRGSAARVVTPEFILVHTLAHLLIRQMAFECGYDSSSIRERLYVSAAQATPMTGFLLYTASGDAEGTLGGLVRQGRPGRLERTLRSAMRNASICSSDPLCVESMGQGLFSMNLSACHACGLLPETSCEEGNLLLDRVAAIGMPDRPALGYFGDLLDE